MQKDNRFLRRKGFYPRHPRGWRPLTSTPSTRPSTSFYPRHPRGWRRNDFGCRILAFLFLSTPPSRVATCKAGGCAARQNGFYPRHPRGWRPERGELTDRLGRFLSTPPSRVATRQGGGQGPANRFLSTPPSRVATAADLTAEYGYIVSIHATLAGGDLAAGRCVASPTEVSIHATLAGGDGAARLWCRSQWQVSIHATLAGGDEKREHQHSL